MAKSRKPVRPPAQLTALADVLAAVSADLNLNRKVQEMAVLSLWPALVGHETAVHTRATAIRRRGHQTILYVRVAHAALASDLSFRTGELLQAINGYEPQTGIRVDAIQMQVGSL